MSAPPTFGYQAGCSNHPDREAMGICVGCRAAVCSECATKIEGMNYCLRCLERATSKSTTVDDPRRELLRGIPLLAGSFALTILVFTFIGLLAASFR